MKTLRLFIIILIFSLFGLVTCAHYTNHYYPNQLENAINNLVFIKTIDIVEGDANTEKEELTFGIPLKDDIILVLIHTISLVATKKVYTPDGFCISTELNILSEKQYINDKEVELIGKRDDIALLRFKTGKKFPFKFGDFSKVRIGDEAMVIGYSNTNLINVKTGIVSTLYYDWSIYEPRSKCFMISAPINFGDSGGVVLAQIDGTYEIIGIVVGANFSSRGIGIAFQSNYVQDCINAILNFEFDEF